MVILLVPQIHLLAQPTKSIEQKAMDYFIENIFIDEFSEVHKVEFSESTERKTDIYSLGIMLNCEEWKRKYSEQFLKDYSFTEIKIDINEYKLNFKKIRKGSNRIKLYVHSAFQIEDKFYVLFCLYKRLHFTENYLFELNKDGEVRKYCKQSEII